MKHLLPSLAALLLTAVVMVAQDNGALPPVAIPNLPAGGKDVTDIQMLTPGFSVRALPLELRNINTLRYREDGKLVALSFEGKVYVLSDSDGDGLEDKAELFYDPGDLSLSLYMALTPPGYPLGRGVFIARKGAVTLQLDTNGDDRADKEVIVAEKWETPERFPGGATDTIGVAIDREGYVYFGLGAANSQNGYLLDKGVAHYKVTSERGTVLKVSPDFSKREIVATGVRASYGMEFNAKGDLFVTDQEGATWLANGNAFDELLHIQPGRHYGFPPRHPKHLPNVIDEPSVFDYGPQHQCTCGVFFNNPVHGGPLFGPDWWRDDAIISGEARGKLYRTKLIKTPSGYVGQNQIFACVGWLAIDQCVSPQGDLVLSVHSGPPDWGTGALGIGRLFKITPTDRDAAQPTLTYALSPTELRVTFDRPLPEGIEKDLAARTTLTSGTFVREGDRFESFRPGYRAVDQQQAAPRNKPPVKAARISEDRRTLIFETDSRTFAQPCAIDIDDWPRGGRTLKDERPQKSVIGVAADSTGVEAVWRSADGKTTWSGWLPSYDLQVAQEVTAASGEHQALWKLLAQPGTLTLRGQLDLWNMLRPAIQPGKRLDWTPPAERVTLVFAVTDGPAPKLTSPGLAAPAAIASEGATTRLLRYTPKERQWLPLEVAIETGQKQVAPNMHLSWSTAEDERPRAMALRRVMMPWSRVAPRPVLPNRPPELAGGDWERGKQAFVTCATCHAINGEGARVGPDLSNLVHRDYTSVVKDIVEPNATINFDYVASIITLKSGEERTAVVIEDNEDHIVLAVQGGGTEKLAKADIVKRVASPVSLMPTGLDQGLGPQGMKDLLTYLMTPPPEPKK